MNADDSTFSCMYKRYNSLSYAKYTLIDIMYTGVTKKLYWFLGKTGCYFQKLYSNSKISCISFKKEISILSHITKTLKASQYFKNCS